jgi:hypothetical protein
VKRRLVNLLAVASVVLIAVLIVSCFRIIGIEGRLRLWSLHADAWRGSLRLLLEYDERPVRGSGVRLTDETELATLRRQEEAWTWPAVQNIQSSPVQHVRNLGWIPTPWVHDLRWAGFRVYINTSRRIPELAGDPPVPALKTWMIYLPAWSVGGVCVLNAAAGLFIAIRRRRHQITGICSKCGYDLRATPERCPECGAIPRKFEGASNSRLPNSKVA